MKYFASFRANNGSSVLKEPILFTNKKTAINTIKNTIKANHFQQPFNESFYTVWDDNGYCVAAGSLSGMGQWHVYKELIDHKIIFND